MDANNLWWHFGRFAEAVGGLDPAAEQLEASMVEHPRLRVYALKGKRTTLLWCRDARNGWREELEQRQPPEKLRGAEVDLRPVLDAGAAAVRFYDPWRNKWSNGRLKDGVIRLPDFSRSLVVRIVRQ